MSYVLVVYSSKNGHVKQMAREIAAGIEMEKVEAKLRTVPNVSSNCESTEPNIPDSGAPYVQLEEVINCAGIILGSPTHFGNMSAELKYFIDQTSGLWMSGALINKPAGVFTASSSMHGGQESTLLSMMLPLLHHGALISGIPYSEKSLNQTSFGGTPYGASYVVGHQGERSMDIHEKTLCQALGKRIAYLSKCLTK